MQFVKSVEKPKTPTFSSKNLSEAFSDVHEIFEMHQRDINAVSDDIKNLELYVRSRNVVVEFSEIFRDNKTHVNYRLSWSKPESDAKDFRLICDVLDWAGDEENGDWVARESRPLIESPLPTRMAVYKFLPEFTRALAKSIIIFSRPKPVPEVEEPDLEDDEIPF